MASQINPTPILKGKDARRFLKEMEKPTEQCDATISNYKRAEEVYIAVEEEKKKANSFC